MIVREEDSDEICSSTYPWSKNVAKQKLSPLSKFVVRSRAPFRNVRNRNEEIRRELAKFKIGKEKFWSWKKRLFPFVKTKNKYEDVGFEEDIMEIEGVKIGSYRLGRVLGKGKFGTVFVGDHCDAEPESIAIKAIHKRRIFVREELLKSLNLEIGILRAHSHHPNIVVFHEKINARNCFYLVLEKATTDLHKLRSRTNAFDVQPDLCQQIMRGIMEGAKYLHERGIAHMDLKPRNVLIQTSALDRDNKRHVIPGRRIEASDIRLCDFGCVQVSSNYSPNNTEIDLHSNDGLCEQYAVYWRRPRGTPGFMAAEMVALPGQKCCYEARVADMWSIGCILMAISIGMNKDWRRINQKRKILNTPVEFHAGIHSYLENLRRNEPEGEEERLLHDLMVDELLVIDPRKRSSCRKALRHPWFHQGQRCD